jgi:hypothetical protein
LESDITERYNKDKDISALGGSIDEQIKKLRKDCQWDEVTYQKTKCFILSKNPEAISTEEFKRYVRGELERIKL